MTSAEQPNGRRDHPVGEVGEDILAIAAYYERKERLRPRRQSAENGQANEQADVEKVVEKPKKRARTGKPGTGAGSVSKAVTKKSSEGLQIGQRIEVLFDDPLEYFPGTITGKYKGRWQIEYDDGDREELDLSTTGRKNHKYRVLRGEAAKGAAPGNSGSRDGLRQVSKKPRREGSRKSGRVKKVEKKAKEEGKKAAATKAKAKAKKDDTVSRLEISNQDQDTLWLSLETEGDLMANEEAGEEWVPRLNLAGELLLDPERVEAQRKLLRRRWEFAGVCHFCRMFSTDLKVKKFSSDQLENALLDPNSNQLFLTELVYRLSRENPNATPPDSKFYARESNMVMDKWGGELQRRLKTWWFKQYFEENYAARGRRRPLEAGQPPEAEEEHQQNGADGDVVMAEAASQPAQAAQDLDFMKATPLDRLLVLHSLVEWRIEACPFVRQAVDRTVKDADYGAPALREEPAARDRHGNRYYYFSQGGEDCRLYAEKPAEVTMRHCLTVDTQAMAEFCTPCTTLEDMQALCDGLEGGAAERREAHRKQKRSLGAKGKAKAVEAYWRSVKDREDEEAELIRVLREEVVPHLEETAAARKRKEERERLYEMAVKKRSSRIASISMKAREEEEQAKREAEKREELAAERAKERERKERERRLEMRAREMQLALERAKEIAREKEIIRMVERERRLVHRMNMSFLMREICELNTKSWQEVSCFLSFVSSSILTSRLSVQVVATDLEWGCKGGRTPKKGDQDRWVLITPKKRERTPFGGNAAAAAALEAFKARAAAELLRAKPALSDGRQVKCRLAPNQLSKKALLNTPEKDLKYVNLRLIFHFPKDNSFDAIHQRGLSLNLFN